MAIARLYNGSVAEELQLSMNDVPEHKRARYLPIEGTRPEYDARVETLSGPVYRIEAERVLKVWTKTLRSEDELKAAFAAAIQAHVDAVAKSKSYYDGVAVTSYALSTVPEWAAEASTFIEWRDSAWSYAHGQLAAVLSGERAMPTVEEMVAELPSPPWPVQ